MSVSFRVFINYNFFNDSSSSSLCSICHSFTFSLHVFLPSSTTVSSSLSRSFFGFFSCLSAGVCFLHEQVLESDSSFTVSNYLTVIEIYFVLMLDVIRKTGCCTPTWRPIQSYESCSLQWKSLCFLTPPLSMCVTDVSWPSDCHQPRIWEK